MGTNQPGGVTITPKHPSALAVEIEAARVAQRPQAMFKIDEIDLAAASLSIDFTTIPQTFRSLKLHASLRGDFAGAFTGLNLNMNGSEQDGIHYRQYLQGNAANAVAQEALAVANSRQVGLVPAGTSNGAS